MAKNEMTRSEMCERLSVRVENLQIKTPATKFKFSGISRFANGRGRESGLHF